MALDGTLLGQEIKAALQAVVYDPLHPELYQEALMIAFATAIVTHFTLHGEVTVKVLKGTPPLFADGDLGLQTTTAPGAPTGAPQGLIPGETIELKTKGTIQ